MKKTFETLLPQAIVSGRKDELETENKRESYSKQKSRRQVFVYKPKKTLMREKWNQMRKRLKVEKKSVMS